MLRLKRKKSNIDFLVLLALFAVFLLSTMFIVLFGANIYQKTANEMQQNFSLRTTVAYITEKVQKNDYTQGVSLREENGNTLLELHQETETSHYITYLYYYDHYLREITQKAEAPFMEEYGTPVIELSSLSFSAKKNLLICHFTTTEGIEKEFFISTVCNNFTED